MAVEIRVPQLGESVVEATIARWLKKEGDALAAGDPVVELETEKVNIEVPADAAGVLAQIAHREGETVRVGEVLGVLDGEPPQTATDGAADSAVAAPPPESAVSAQVTPVARRLAEEHGIDPQGVPGSGPGGRVMKEDVLELIERAAPPAAPQGVPPAVPVPLSVGSPVLLGAVPLPAAPTPPAAPSIVAVPAPTLTDASRGESREQSRVRLSRRRLTIARPLVEAQQSAAMLTTFNEVDMSAVMELRKRRRDSFKERHGVNLGFMSFFAKAAIGALKAFPSVNAELQGEELILKRYYDIGVAVSTEEGLVVPV
ncbi:MAG: 2-oxo acid dehydrogenase subunit E2, partial [Chloroflexota bacterium]|nr:2-oxo acid dehydrogenase subunit E2 [Chloroflexota bacterium]